MNKASPNKVTCICCNSRFKGSQKHTGRRSSFLPTMERQGGWGPIRHTGRWSTKLIPCSGNSQANKCQGNLIIHVHFYDITNAYSLAYHTVTINQLACSKCLYILIHLILTTAVGGSNYYITPIL